MSWILAKNSSKDIALAGSDSNMPANMGVKRSLSPLKKNDRVTRKLNGFSINAALNTHCDRRECSGSLSLHSMSSPSLFWTPDIIPDLFFDVIRCL